MDYKGLAQKYGTPLYIYDFNHIKERYNELKNAFSGRKSLVCYAVKANSNLSILRHLANLGAGFDCVSIGEVKRALMAGAKPYQVIFSGVGKSDDEIKTALNSNILMLNLESEAELDRVCAIAKELNKTARISIRINPDVDAKTHPYISTGLNENKFGVDVMSAKKMYLKAKNSAHIEPVGVHFHIGSQITEISSIIEAANIVAKVVSELKALEIDIKFFDVGGGVGIVYDDEQNVSLYDYAQGILAALKGLDVTIVCEPGRFIVGNAGVLLSSVLYEKFNKNRRFVVVDAAMNDLIRPSLYDAHHGVEFLGKNEQISPCDIVGPICESGDFLAKNLNLPKCQSGDLILIKSAGAYGFSMSSNYNTRPRAAEIGIEDGKDRLIRRREKFEDLIALETEFLN
ncbi:diaminopimelate decarboxylase [Campylobacter gastrosuis]|uniref:Diaminopimelate decarboxylase n=1 Tax=Campylobacter gastrosuis TaxID=2974576 RepID=A0ABT7HPZ6_9BACT|nr:diaminopimelate decarboxylase [Campylobacter gastrosuis]MDL0088745.1 diaminopimelate decarboxylase [Campylobacter gastrosuis]